jgi:hypothetical protein
VSFDLDSPAASLGFVDGVTGVIMGDGAWIQHDQGVDAEQWKAMLTHAARD